DWCGRLERRRIKESVWLDSVTQAQARPFLRAGAFARSRRGAQAGPRVHPRRPQESDQANSPAPQAREGFLTRRTRCQEGKESGRRDSNPQGRAARGLKAPCGYQFRHARNSFQAPPAGFEPATDPATNRQLCPLSYGGVERKE